MSHVSSIAIRITDLNALEEACKALGWTFNRNRKTYNWFGSWVDDSPVPEHLFTPEEYKRICGLGREARKKELTAFLSKCDHSITVPGAEYEIAVREMEDGTFTLGFDWYNQPDLLKALGGKTAPKLVQGYGVSKVKLEAARYGHLFESEERLKDGSVKIRLLASRY